MTEGPKPRRASAVWSLSIGFAVLFAFAAGLQIWVSESDRPVPAQSAPDLQGTLRGYREAVLYARTDGHVAVWYKTIGEQVLAGEVLATVSSPEQERELNEARATRDRARARAALTDLAAAEENVQRLEQRMSSLHVVAPFDGVITRRDVDVGTRVRSGTTGMFSLAQITTLRLELWIPLAHASGARTGQRVSIGVKEYPGRRFVGVIEHASGAIDSVRQARQVEVLVPNESHLLMPGTSVSASIDGANDSGNVLTMPNAAAGS